MPGFRIMDDDDLNKMNEATIPVNTEAMAKLMLTLEADYHANDEWDQPAYMYYILGDPEDPYFVKICEAHPSPPVFLQRSWDDGLRVQPEVLGIGFAHEGWRHLRFEELTEKVPDLRTHLLKGAKELFPDADEEEREVEMKKAYYAVSERFPLPSQMPPDLRGEMRIVGVTFRDGSTWHVSRDRGFEPELDEIAPAEIASEGRVPRFIHQMLNNQRPQMREGENLWKDS